MRRKMFPLLLISLIVIPGCLPTRSIEDVQIIHTLGFDYVDEDHVKGIAAMSVYSAGEGETNVRNETISAVSHTSQDIRNLIQMRVPKPLVSGKVSVILFSEELARHGIENLVDSIAREPEIGRNIYIGIVDGNTEELLRKDYSLIETVTQYLDKLFEKNEQNNLPKTNLHLFLNALYGKGMDPFLPIVMQDQGEITLNGLALFSKEKMVGKISKNDMFIFKLLNEEFDSGLYEVFLDGKYVAFNNIGSLKQVEYVDTKPIPSFRIRIRMEGRVTETTTPKRITTEKAQKIEQEIAEVIRKRAVKMIRQFQQKGIDPLALGEVARSKTRKWNEKEWYKLYPKMNIQVDVQFNITQIGILE